MKYTSELIITNLLMNACLTILLILLLGCNTSSQKTREENKLPLTFNPDLLTVKGTHDFEKAKGQLVYLPLYANIPYHDQTKTYDLSGFLTIHNTDLRTTLKVSHIYFFNNNGVLVKDYLGKDTLMLQPLQSKSFFVPSGDQSGTGANFLVEWKTNTLISIPLIETVMISLNSGQGVSFLSKGKVIEQMTE